VLCLAPRLRTLGSRPGGGRGRSPGAVCGVGCCQGRCGSGGVSMCGPERCLCGLQAATAPTETMSKQAAAAAPTPVKAQAEASTDRRRVGQARANSLDVARSTQQVGGEMHCSAAGAGVGAPLPCIPPAGGLRCVKRLQRPWPITHPTTRSACCAGRSERAPRPHPGRAEGPGGAAGAPARAHRADGGRRQRQPRARAGGDLGDPRLLPAMPAPARHVRARFASATAETPACPPG
jgi:hypothetical protein